MIKKIVCPTDFSPASINAIEYSAKLAQQVNAMLTLLHIEPVSMGEGVSLFSGGVRESTIEAKAAMRKLEKITLDIIQTYNIKCDFEVAPSMVILENAIAAEAKKFDLLVTGTNSENNSFQYYVGSNSYRMAKKSNIPVMIIPDDYSYKALDNITLISDYSRHDRFVLAKLKQLANIFNSSVQVIHISEKDTPVSQELYKSFCNAIGEEFDFNPQIKFERIIQNTEASMVDSILNIKTDLLAVCLEEHNVLYRLFHKNLVRELASNVESPMLVFHK